MKKCSNGCGDFAECLFIWTTSQEVQKASLCGACSSIWWNKYKHTNAGESLIIENINEDK